MDATALRAEIQVNYDAFQRQLGTLLPAQLNRYALMRHGELVEVFDKPARPIKQARSAFPMVSTRSSK